MNSTVRMFLMSLICIFVKISIACSVENKDWIGVYNGIGEASGQTLKVMRSAGKLYVNYSQASQTFVADQEGDWLQGVDVNQQELLYRLRREAVGISLIRVPLNVQPDAEELPNIFYFIEQGVSLPQLPEDFIEEPSASQSEIDTIAFLKSYPFWSPQAVAVGYALVPDTFKSVIQLYPYVQTDLAWKICQASVAERRNVSPILLRTQGATCESILETMQDVQMKKKFTSYKETVDLQSRDAQDAIACARGEKMTKECDTISKKTADYALNIKTVKAVLEDVQH
jgi:hypothetical protein